MNNFKNSSILYYFYKFNLTIWYFKPIFFKFYSKFNKKLSYKSEPQYFIGKFDQ
jgi:hypothetical protein